jgi:predicted HTH transcriptional regulator
MPHKTLTPMLQAHELGTMLDHGWLPRGLPYRQAWFLTLLRVRPSLTRSDYQALTKISPNTAQADLARLVEAGLIERVGAGPSSRYTLPLSYRDRLAVTLDPPQDVPEITIQSPQDHPNVAP